MRCRALTATGARCQNQRAEGHVLCTRHLNQETPVRLIRETLEEVMAQQMTPRQPVTPVRYEVVAMTLRNSDIPREHILALATDLSEAFRERDERFDIRTFLQLATS